MRSFFKKSLCIAVLSVFMAVLMAFQTPVAKVSAAGDPYISDLQIVMAANLTEAKKKVTAGYTIVETPLSEKDSRDRNPYMNTYLCYKTTDKKEDAIYDIKTLSMNDNYSYSKYASYVEMQKDYSYALIAYISPAIYEYRQNLNAGGEISSVASDMLSCLYEDDSKMCVSELFEELDFGKNQYLSDDSIELLVPLFLQGNMEFVLLINQLLLASSHDLTGKKQAIWIDYLDQLADAYALNDEEYVMADNLDYSDEVKLLKSMIPDVQSDIQYYLNCEKEHPFTEEMEAEMEDQSATFEEERAKAENKSKSDTMLRKEIAAARAEEEPDGAAGAYNEFYLWILNEGSERQAKWESGRKLCELQNFNYPLKKYDTFFDLFMADPDTTDKKDYYPMINAMTPGQRSMILTGLGTLLKIAVTPKDEYIEQLELCMEEQGIFDPEHPISVYEGVDRSLYDPDGIAMTEHAMEYATSGKESPFENTIAQNMHNALSIALYVTGGLAATGCAIMLGLTAIAVLNAAFITKSLSASFQLVFIVNPITSMLAKVTAYVTIAIIIILAIVLIVREFWGNPDATYKPIPRVLCSKEDRMYKGIDANGKDIFGDGYLYYYGVKNPKLGNTVMDNDGTTIDTSNQVMDIYAWQLSGMDRQWIALYYSKDPRIAYMDAAGTIHRLNPIKAGTLAVVANTQDGASCVSDFGNTTCEMMFWYQRTHNEWKDIPSKYLSKAHYTDSDFKKLQQESASVFADNVPLALGSGGLVLGALGGTFVTLATKKKKKPTVTEQA